MVVWEATPESCIGSSRQPSSVVQRSNLNKVEDVGFVAVDMRYLGHQLRDILFVTISIFRA